MELTVGMATYRDFDGVYFTVQALRLYQDMEGVEILVVDNFGCEATRSFVEESAGGRYILAPELIGTAAPRNLVFQEAHGKSVLCIDCHVLLAPGTLRRLKRFYRTHPRCSDLLQGPLVDDNLDTMASHLDPMWCESQWGVWDLDPRAQPERKCKPFEIPMQGLGLFSCRRAAWPGFHPGFRGWGGEEGYIHQKFRNLGRRCLCLPWLRWVHRFPRPAGVPYPLHLKDRITNYLIGHRDVGLDEGPVLEHFRVHASAAEIVEALRDADAVLPRPAKEARPVPCILHPPPLISCLCPTYGRCGTRWQYLLEEAVESFLRQTDVHSELLILNDHPAQEVAFDHPRVRIINHPQRFRTLGEKYNALVSQASGELLAPWEDDDISLPYRLELSRERLGECDYFNPRRYWFLDQRGLHRDHPIGVGHNLSLFRRRAWQAVRGYPVVTGMQDQKMDTRLVRHPHVQCCVDEEPLAVSEWYYIYRWGVSPYHLSGQRNMQRFYNSLHASDYPAGRFNLRPHWRQDYVALVGVPSPGDASYCRPSAEPTNGERARRRRYQCDTTLKRGAAYLSGVGLVEHWECGTAYFKHLVPAGCYRGISSLPSSGSDKVADLAAYTSSVDGIFIHHVLEHDLRWRRILHNALASFRHRMVLVVSTPFVRATEEHHRCEVPDRRGSVSEIHFCRRDLIHEFGTLSFRLEENVPTESPFGREHVFYLNKDGPA